MSEEGGREKKSLLVFSVQFSEKIKKKSEKCEVGEEEGWWGGTGGLPISPPTSLALPSSLTL